MEREYPMPPPPWLSRFNGACGFFYGGYLKSKVFEDNSPKTTQALKQRTRDEIEVMRVNMLREALQNFQFRLQECIHFNGDNLASVV